MAGAPAVSVNADCFRCHAMQTLTRRTADGGLENLSVTPEGFAHSEHRDLSCTKCHAASFSRFPHPAAPKKACLDCHKDKPELAKMFAEIGASFGRSVHARKKGFDCFRCHDPHRFARWKDVSRRSIAERNGICLGCHATPAADVRFEPVNAPAPPGRDASDLERAHAFLPHADLHMRQVRCLDCHTEGGSSGDAHRILAKESAVRDCVQCHSTNSVLRDKLYRYRRTEETARRGFLNAAIVNDAYVIGATRNRLLDGAGFLMLGLTGAGIAMHYTLRRRARRRPVLRTDEEETP